MNELLQKIEEIIKREFKVNAIGGEYAIEEQNEQNYPKTVLKQKGKMLIYTFDTPNSNAQVFPIFESRIEGVTAICDYIVFYPKGNTLFIFLCEQKTSKTSAKTQVEAAFVFANYIVRTAQRLLKFKEYSIEFRALVFSTNQSAKFSTNLQNEGYVKLAHSGLKNKLLKAGGIYHLDNFCI